MHPFKEPHAVAFMLEEQGPSKIAAGKPSTLTAGKLTI
jgi:hypothetical protein